MAKEEKVLTDEEQLEADRERMRELQDAGGDFQKKSAKQQSQFGKKK
jgi:hypothetical protein